MWSQRWSPTLVSVIRFGRWSWKTPMLENTRTLINVNKSYSQQTFYHLLNTRKNGETTSRIKKKKSSRKSHDSSFFTVIRSHGQDYILKICPEKEDRRKDILSLFLSPASKLERHELINSSDEGSISSFSNGGNWSKMFPWINYWKPGIFTVFFICHRI